MFYTYFFKYKNLFFLIFTQPLCKIIHIKLSIIHSNTLFYLKNQFFYHISSPHQNIHSLTSQKIKASSSQLFAAASFWLVCGASSSSSLVAILGLKKNSRKFEIPSYLKKKKKKWCTQIGLVT